MHNYFLAELSSVLAEAIKQNFKTNITESELYENFSEPPERAKGDLAFPFFPLAKTLKSSPVQIATKIQSSIKLPIFVKEAKCFGPYLNFYLDTAKVGEILIPSISSNKEFEKKIIEKPESIMVEYSQPNTHKELHVGHMRNLCLGNALCRILAYCGNKVIPATYPGDVGTHVAKTLWYLKTKNLTPPAGADKGVWLGSIYTKAHQAIENLDETELETTKVKFADILREIEKKSGEYFDLWKETREWSLELMKKTYQWADVQFDRWFFESEVDSSSLEYANELYKKGVFIKNEGAVGMDLSEYKLGFCLMIKSDGTGLYATKDIELARRKFNEYGVERNIYVVDTRQAYHFKQVFKTLEKIGFKDADKCYHLEYDMVELPDGAMSSRKGNIVPINKLIHNMELMIEEKYLEKYKDEWKPDEIKSTATKIAIGAIKYGMTRIDSKRKIVFDLDEWLKLDGETGPYIQYVFARINSLLSKFDFNKLDELNFNKLESKYEHELLLFIMKFNDIVENCAKNYKTHTLTGYLYDLAKTFNSFYAECPIGKVDDIELRKVRLSLSNATAVTLKKGLELLGITPPERM